MPAPAKLSLDERAAVDAECRALVEDLLEADGLMPLEVADWLDLARRAAPPSARVARWLDDAVVAWVMRRRGGHPGATGLKRLVQYRCVGACEALVAKEGMRPRQAAETLAPIVRRMKIRTSRGGKVTGATIYGWWKKLHTTPGARLMRRELTESGATPAIRETAARIFRAVK